MADELFADLAAFTSHPRLTGLALNGDGSRLVATVQQPDAKGARYASSIWEIGIDGSAPVRLTHSTQGETDPAFLPDGSLLFVSARSAVEETHGESRDDSAVWRLPVRGEAAVFADNAGGLGRLVVAARSGVVLSAGSRLVGSAPDDDDAGRRQQRKDRKISAILHTGMPIRHWDHELGDESVRLFSVAAGQPVRDLAPDAGFELAEATYSISADGTSLATTWMVRRPHGRRPGAVAVIDVATGRRMVLKAETEWHYLNPVISPDGSRVALLQEQEGTFEQPPAGSLVIVSITAARHPVTPDLGDLEPTEWAWSADSTRLFVAGDLHGRGAVLVVEATTGLVARLAIDAAYSSLCPDPSGRYIYALRSSIDEPPTPVRLDALALDQEPHRLPSPAAVPALPGTLVRVSGVGADGVEVGGWLVRPTAAGPGPVPVMLWIHGGPFGSWNAWSWRWNPWVAAAAGWAVVLPDPALSTGYGAKWLERAWPYLAAQVFADCETVLDAALQQPGLDRDRVACLGASFGGYMTNWIAGHSTRFKAIVTHAGLWALDQQHMTTDAADYKTGIFGVPADHPDWYQENSPHHSADAISTPMLVIHGNRDYRVPLSEAIRLWWDLARRHDGPAETMPHRFLQLTGENHWVLSPANAEIWYSTVLGFCAQHVLGQPFTPSPLL
jgi:dipeptidyl aminopeptidase/acylaminoacyl peptidase